MTIKKHRYNTCLANYFLVQPLFFDSDKQKKPNIRKCVELPFQQTKAEMWDEVISTLCNLLFIEAKCYANMVFVLIDDYHHVNNNLPENKSEVRKENLQRELVNKWTQDLIEYSRKWNERRNQAKLNEIVNEKEPELSKPPDSINIWSQKEIQNECFRIIKNPSRVDKLNLYRKFIERECHALSKYGQQYGFVIQHAINYSPSGILRIEVEEVRYSLTTPILLKKWAVQDTFYPKPAILKTLEGHENHVDSVSVTPDGIGAISASSDGTVRIWNLEKGTCDQILLGNAIYIGYVTMTPDMKLAASDGFGDDSIIWDLTSGTSKYRINGIRISMTPDGRRAISTHLSRTIKLWDLDTGECLRIIQDNADNVIITSDGRFALAMGGYQNYTLRIWDLESGICLGTLNGHLDTVASASITPDGHIAVSASTDETLRLWNLKSRVCIGILKGHQSAIRSVSMTPDGRLAISSSHDNSLRVWDLKKGICLRVLEGHESDIYCVGITANGRKAISSSYDGTLKVWDIETGSLTKIIGHKGKIQNLTVTPDGKLVISSASLDTNLRVWDIQSGICIFELKGHSDRIMDIKISGDGNWAVSASLDKSIRLWDLKTGKCLRRLDGHIGQIFNIHITPDVRLAVSNGDEDIIYVWDIENGNYICLNGHESQIKNSVLLLDKNWIITSAQYDKTIKMWNLKSGKCIRELIGHKDFVLDLKVTPDGQKLVSTSMDHKIIVWDLEKGSCLGELVGHGSFITSIMVTSDGVWAITGSQDKTIRIWNLETYNCMIIEGFCSDHNCEIKLAAITTDNKWIMTIQEGVYCKDHAIRIWDLATGACLKTLTGHSSLITSARIIADGKFAISTSEDKTIRVWDLNTSLCSAIIYGEASWTTAAISNLNLVVGNSLGKIVVFEIQNLLSQTMNSESKNF